MADDRIWVTPEGFQRKTLQEFRVEFNAGFRQIYGAKSEVGVESPDGMLISLLLYALSSIEELGQVIYDGHNINSAMDEALDSLGVLAGVSERKAAASSTVGCICYGEDTYLPLTLGTDSQVLRQRGSKTFTLNADLEIKASVCRDVYITGAGVSGSSYAFVFSFGTYTIVSSGDALEDMQTLAALIRLDSSFTGVAVAYADNLDAPETAQYTAAPCCRVILQDTNFSLEVSSPYMISVVGSYGLFSCDDVGAETVSAGEISTIVSSIQGWLSVYNYEDATLGRLRETNSEYRIRILATRGAIKGKSTDDTLQAHLIDDIASVTYAVVTSNRTMLEDAAGRPPKSFEALVIGGTDNEIAQVIWDNCSQGIEFYGSSSGTAVDLNGNAHTVYFNRATTKYLWIRVTYTKYSEETFPDDGQSQISDAIVSWATTEYQLGKDVIPDRIKTPIYTVPGVGASAVEVAVTDLITDTPSYQSGVISVAPTVAVSVAASRISFVENA